MIKLKSLICEALEDLYHSTGIDSMLNILKDDSIKLTFGAGSEAETPIMKGRHFFLSMMRQKVGNYARGRASYKLYPSNISCIIHLDGVKLSKNYKIGPVDYWGGGRERSEQEDRLVSNNDQIPQATKYIKDVHIYIPPDLEKEKLSVATLIELDKLSKQKNVSIYYYSDINYFMQHRTSGATTNINDLFSTPELTDDELEHLKYREYIRTRPRTSYTDEMLRIWFDEPPNDKELKIRLINLFQRYSYELMPVLGADVHNMKSNHTPVLAKLSKAMRQSKSKSFKDFIVKMQEKIKNINL
jgi:hypothetical protein